MIYLCFFPYMAHLVAIPWAMDMLKQPVGSFSIQLRRPRHELNRQKLVQVSTSWTRVSDAVQFQWFHIWMWVKMEDH